MDWTGPDCSVLWFPSDWTGLPSAAEGLDWTETFGPVQSRPNQASPVRSDRFWPGPANLWGIDDRGPVLANQKWRIRFLSRVTGPILKGEGPGPGHTLCQVIYRYCFIPPLIPQWILPHVLPHKLPKASGRHQSFDQSHCTVNVV